MGQFGCPDLASTDHGQSREMEIYQCILLTPLTAPFCSIAYQGLAGFPALIMRGGTVTKWQNLRNKVDQ
jgi:hypothetical protein